MGTQQPRDRAASPRVECRTVEGRTVWVRWDAIGIVTVADRREDVEADRCQGHRGRRAPPTG